MGPADGKVRWGDSADFDDEGLEDVLPPSQVIGPDANGIKYYIEYRKNDQGLTVKATKKVRVKKQVKKLSKDVIKRRQWKRFGGAAGQHDNENVTLVSVEEIFLERSNLGNKKEEAKPSGEIASLGNTSLIVCRICSKKGDHWTSKCPYKDLAKDLKGFSVGEKAPEDGEAGSAAAGAGATGKSAYVPPSMRGGAGSRGEGESMRQRGRDDNSIRVTNLSEDTREGDLQELFRPFGPISRIYIAYDKETGLSRGFAFINFVNRDDAVRAINKLDGYGYDNLILRVEWATPRSDRG